MFSDSNSNEHRGLLVLSLSRHLYHLSLTKGDGGEDLARIWEARTGKVSTFASVPSILQAGSQGISLGPGDVAQC